LLVPEQQQQQSVNNKSPQQSISSTDNVLLTTTTTTAVVILAVIITIDVRNVDPMNKKRVFTKIIKKNVNKKTLMKIMCQNRLRGIGYMLFIKSDYSIVERIGHYTA
jgi:hypothetical protein